MEVSKSKNFILDRRESDVAVENDRRTPMPVEKQEKLSFLNYAMESVPTFRRIASIPDKIQNNETATAIGMASLALINVPEDLRDVKGAYRQIKAKIKGEEFKAAYDFKNYQHSFSFFRGTMLEGWLVKKMRQGKKWADWLLKNDKTLAGTKVGENITNALKVELKDEFKTEIIDKKGYKAKAYLYEGSAFGKLTARAMRRTTKFGLVAMGLLEVPKIIKSMTKGDDLGEKSVSTLKQTTKSAINVASIAAGIGYCGAIGSKYGKGFGSLVGMGIGAILGSKLSEKAQQII